MFTLSIFFSSWKIVQKIDSKGKREKLKFYLEIKFLVLQGLYIWKLIKKSLNRPWHEKKTIFPNPR